MDTDPTEELEGIAIIGMSGRFPGANNVDEFWQNLVNRVDCISRYNQDEVEYSVLTPEAIAEGAKSVSARGVLENVDMFDASFFGIYPKEAEVMDPQHRIFLECAWESIESAGYNPETYPGMIGVYAGASLNTYLLNNLCGDSGFASKIAGNYQISEYQTMLGNDKDFMPTRVSYKLNLRGPSMAIQTACSTSLVAISQACSSLLSYQCDMALSGGVSISFPQRRDYLYQEDGMASIDGTCRTFDADAKGTVFGHGSAVVLLKRLSDAMADGDNILAVIKGTAINNDGSEKIGYAAPSINAQADVISMAQAVADVEPDSISYIEAHGTGTPLGDPIEIAALTQAFRGGGATGNGFCAIGTGKPNISHLDVAAGATGLIKTILQLQNEQIPPLLHFKSPNPKIDFANSPFYPVTEVQDWKRGDQPRRAGISAFGVGGTNAHVVVEEAPLRKPRPVSDGHQVFVVSAKTETALATMRENLAAKIESNSDLDLADVAYTLQVGRSSFAHRSIVVAGNRDELIAGLRLEPKKSFRAKASISEPGVVFLFPGQGAQYVDMGRDLYQRESVFRDAVDRCAEILIRHLGQDVRSVLFPKDDSAREDSEKRINETSMTQPAIFVVEYALSQLWMSWGIKPAALIGHSIGEYVCAVLAETFTLEDALALLSIRAKMMQELPCGSMLGVRLSAQEVEPMLPPGASIAAMNSPKLCTVSGAKEVLEAFLVELEDKGFTGRMLATSHAFHSSMMDPMLEKFTQASEKIARRAPKIHWISSCTGKVMTDVETSDASYWSRQLRNPVRFADALDTLLANEYDYVLIEVGPGRALNQFVRQHPAKISTERILVSIGQPEIDDCDLPSTLTALGKLWAVGVQPDWETLHKNHPRLRVPLPTYPFERKRFWIEPPKSDGNSRSHASSEGTAATGQSTDVAITNGLVADAPCTQPVIPTLAIPARTNTTAVPTAAAAPSVSRNEKIRAELRNIILNLSGMEIEDDDATFMDLGFDSLFLSQASQAIFSRFSIRIKFRQLLGELSSISAIADDFEPKIPADMFAAAEPIATAPEVASAIPLAATSLSPGSSQNLSDVQRLLAGHVQTLQQLLQQSHQQPATQSAGNGLRTVRKPDGGNTDEVAESAMTPKRFGPYKPIEKGEQGGLTATQENALNRLIDRYVKRTSKSKDYTAEHRPHFADPRAVSGFKSQWKEMVYPIVSARSKGAKIWDIDDNEYVDITMGFGTYFFGHSPDWLTDAIEKQLRTGIEIGPQSPVAGKVAKMISEFTGLERVTFCNTGSEAVMAAMRLARTVTGRNRIVYFAGDYHGMFEEVLVRGAWPRGEYRAQPIAPGIPASLAENILVLEYGTDESLEIIRQHGDEIAAVMVEPVQSRNPSFQPREFLHQVRAITKDIGAALIFDEVVTGFRCHQGGAQAYFGIEADMATYGKVVGGGLPIGVLAGSPQYMDALDGGMWQYGDDSFPEVGVTFFAGTFVRHPLAIAAAHAVLKFLKEAGPELQFNMTKRVEKVVATINQDLNEAQVPIQMSSFSAFAAIDYAPELKYASLLWYYMRDKGIHIWEGRPCYFTIAHTDEDLQRFVDAFRESVAEMQADGFLPPRGDATQVINHANNQFASNDASQLGVSSELAANSLTNSNSKSLPSNSIQDSNKSFPLAEGQREMWLGAQMSPDAAGPHHACNAFILEGELDLNAMRTAFSTVVDRHEGLRCTFNADGTEVLIQPNFQLELPLIDLSKLSPQEQDSRVEAIMDNEGQRLFDLADGPLIDVQILKLSETKHQLIVTAQMIACDGWSHYVVFEEVSEIYSAIREGREPRLEDVIQMREYASWQNQHWETSEAKECEDYWRSQYETTPAPLDLPTIHRRPLSRSVNAKRTDILLPAEFYDEIKQYGRSQRNSSFAVLLAAFQVWLHRLSGANDIVVGVPFSAQNPLGLDTLVGQCANTLPLRAKVDRDESFEGLLSRTWDSLLDAQENIHYTFGKLIQHLDLQHDPSRIPLVSVIFNIDPAMTKVKFNGLKHHFFAGPRFFYQFDLGFNLVEEEDGLRVECDYNTNMFDGEVVNQWLQGYESLLRSIVAGPSKLISELPMTRNSQDGKFAGARLPIGDSTTVHQLIAGQTDQVDETIAVRDGKNSFTYSELNDRSNQLATQITRFQPTGGRIGVLADQTSDMVVAILSALKSGCTVVPIEPQWSRQQIANVVSDADLGLILAKDGLKEVIDGVNCPVLSSAQAVTQENSLPPNVNVNRDQIAFVLYQANASGTLQGVELSHGAVANFILSMQKTPGIAKSDVVLGLNPLSSGYALLELLLPLTVGAECVMASHRISTDPAALSKLISNSGITLLQATPTMLRKLLSVDWDGTQQLKILVGGEMISKHFSNRLQRCCDELWHMHGQAETTVWTSAQRLMPESRITLGNPIDNTTFAIVDDRNQAVPVGVPGELVVGGQALANGYRNLADLSQQKFIQDPQDIQTGQRVFRSGNFARRLSTGEIELTGRQDSLAMLKGREVDLADVESVLREHPKVDDAAVILRDDLPDQPGAVAYIFVNKVRLASTDKKGLSRELRQLIRSQLPSHMLPDRIAYLDDVPMTLNGTLDRSELPPPPDHMDDEADDYIAPSSSTQKTLVAIWQDVLQNPKVGVNDHFFEIGGQSLLAVKVFARIENELGRKLPLATLFRAPTIAELSAVLDGSTNASDWPSLIPIQPSGSKPPLFLVHGAGGNVLLYQTMTKYFAPEYPLYGLQSLGLDGESEPLENH